MDQRVFLPQVFGELLNNQTDLAIELFRIWTRRNPNHEATPLIYYFTWVFSGRPEVGDPNWGENAFLRQKGRNCDYSVRLEAMRAACGNLLYPTLPTECPGRRSLELLGPKRVGPCGICRDSENEEEEAQELVFCACCRHGFHDQCLSPWFRQFRKTCPLCRRCFFCGDALPHLEDSSLQSDLDLSDDDAPWFQKNSLSQNSANVSTMTYSLRQDGKFRRRTFIAFGWGRTGI